MSIAVQSAYEVLLNACGLVDRSERGKLALSGSGAKPFLHGQVSNDIEGLIPGSGCYAALLTPKGKMRGDLRVLDTGKELLLDTERVSLQELFNTVRRFSVGYDVQVHKRTLERGLFSLVGPRSDEVLGDAAPGTAAEHANREVELAGVRVLAVRTYLGIDLLFEAGASEELLAHLRARGAETVEESVAEILRVERGRPRYGIDIDDSVIPQEAGLNERAVSFTKGCYVGQETVARLYYRGKPNRRLAGLRLSGQADPGTPLSFEGRLAGALGTVVDSPRFGVISLGLIRREVPDGSTVTAADGGLTGQVVALPFSPAGD